MLLHSMTLTNKTRKVQHSFLKNSLTQRSYLCKENNATSMDSYGNNRNQRGRLNNIRSNDEEPEEKVQYGNQDSTSFIDPNNITAQDVLQQRLIERLQAEERLQLRQQNQQLLQLAQNQARRRQLMQQQIRHAVGNVPDPLTDMPLLDNSSLVHSSQQRHRQIEYLRARRENLMQLHLLREQRLRREEELLEEVLREEQRQASLVGLDSGVNLATSSMRLRPLNDAALLQPSFNLRTGMMSGAHLDPELQFAEGQFGEERELMNRIMQTQRNQASTFDVDNVIDDLDASMSRIQNIDSHPFASQINTAPASFRAFDPTRLDPGHQLSRRQFTARTQGEANLMDSIQGVPLQPWMAQSVASGSYPSMEMISGSPSKRDDKKKPVEKKKATSRKKVAGMVCIFFWLLSCFHVIVLLLHRHIS